ncbi:MAG: hypothetical protein AAF669_01585 [Pseudomonadota bacterium]
MNKKILWDEVMTNVVSAFIAALFVGAGVIVWDAASTMDQKIEKAKSELHRQQNSITGTQEILRKELSLLEAKTKILEEENRITQKQLSRANKILSEHHKMQNKDKGWKQHFLEPEPKSPIDLNELENKNLDRLDKLLEQYRLK